MINFYFMKSSSTYKRNLRRVSPFINFKATWNSFANKNKLTADKFLGSYAIINSKNKVSQKKMIKLLILSSILIYLNLMIINIFNLHQSNK